MSETPRYSLHVVEPAGPEALHLAPQGWVCDSEEKATWALDLLIVYEERIARLKAQYESNLHRLESELANARAFFLPHLEAWAQANPPRKGRSIYLATGTVGYRKVPGGLRIEDKDAVLEWARTRLPAAIARQVVERVEAAAIKAHHDATGEVPTGARLVDDEDRFFIKGK